MTTILSWRSLIGVVGLVLLLGLVIGIGSADSRNDTLDSPPWASTDLGWLEPVGLNLATLTGLIPEDDLKDTVLVWVPGSGTVKYDSGVVNGDTIAVTVRYNLTNKEEVWCLGEPPQFDHSGTVQPPATMRVYSDGTDVTDRIQSSFEYIVGGKEQPIAGASTFGSRYERKTANVQFTNGSVVVPANRGCKFTLDAALPNVTAVFTMERQDNISITKVYHQVNDDIHSYIGPGAPGDLAGLQAQMNAAYPNGRHDVIIGWFDITDAQKAAIESSDHVLIKFPTVSHDMYGGTGDSYGTYRFAFNTGRYEYLSVDHISAKLIPRLGHWRDADTQGNRQFLEYFQAMWPHGDNIYENFDSIKSAELFLPPGMDYQPCMTPGNCPADVLQAVYDHTYTVEAIFYRIERIRHGGLEQIPLLSVGNGYNGPVPRTDVSADETLPSYSSLNTVVYIPVVLSPEPEPPDDDPSLCPEGCGWFDEHGQMLDFVPPVQPWSFP